MNVRMLKSYGGVTSYDVEVKADEHATAAHWKAEQGDVVHCMTCRKYSCVHAEAVRTFLTTTGVIA